jgi:hypothetical protein
VASESPQSGSPSNPRLAGLLERLDAEAAQEIGLRSSDRRAVHAPVTLGVVVGGFKPLYRGWATDLSAEGVGLLTEHDVPMGALLHVNLISVAGEELLLPVRICYVSQLMSKTYRVGGAFCFDDVGPGERKQSA